MPNVSPLVEDAWRFSIRVSSFLGKEIVEIWHQPRLIIVLVLGPFLILLLFGIGYRNEARPLRTLFVAQPNSELRPYVEQYATSLGPQLVFVGIAETKSDGLQRLLDGAVDVVVVAPDRFYETIRVGQQAVFELYHNEIDPFQITYVEGFGNVYVSEVNRRVLRLAAQEGQQMATEIQPDLEVARDTAIALQKATQREDYQAARQHLRDLDRRITALALAFGVHVGFLEIVQELLGSASYDGQDEVAAILNDMHDLSAWLAEAGPDQRGDIVQKIAEVQKHLGTLDSTLGEFRRLDPGVLVSPFRSETTSIVPVRLQLSDYYTPSVIVVLLQHVCVTFAGLSLVREQRIGAMELFQVSPLSTIEVLLGKYLSYMALVGGLAAILTSIVVWGLGVPMLGSPLQYTLVVLALIFASLGAGFIISLLSETVSQAVQYSMIVLLGSVFFAGFFLGLEVLWAPVHLFSWMLPATYGIELLRNIMLRGQLGDIRVLGGLGAIGVSLFLVSWLLLRRKMVYR
jgi:ABC-2 type transport system permease protein